MKLLITSVFAIALISTTAFAQQHGDHEHDKSSLTKSDHLQIAAQRICPVMGAKLGSMGEPIKVRMGERDVYVCCKGCVGKQGKPSNWKKIEANVVKAQGTCPIMGKPVSVGMKSTVVNGRQIFVCCAGCVDKVQADGKAAFAKVSASYVANFKAEAQVNSDKQHIAAQGICPVSGGKLGAMGAPIKVQVGDEVAFLCCKGCQGKKINATHWASIQTNLAKAQGVCPVMGEEIDATMKSTVINGRRIFLCCPPCTKKVEAAPGKYVAMLDAQIANGGKAVSHEGHDHDHKGDGHKGHDH